MLPTRHGVLFAMALAVLLLAAVNYGNGLAYLFTFLLASVALVSMLHTHRNVVGLRIGGGAAEPVFAGQEASFRLRIDNPAVFPRPAIWVHGESRERRIDLPPQQAAEVVLNVPAQRRGYVSLPRVSLSSSFPLGLLYTWTRRADLGARCLVYPRPLSLQPLHPSPDRTGLQDPGDNPDGDDFVGLRTYQPTDPPGHVHWKTLARGPELFSKRFGGAGAGRVWLDWDRLEGLDVETRLGQLTRWVLDAENRGMSYGLRVPGRTIAPGRGKLHEQSCLRTLALWQ